MAAVRMLQRFGFKKHDPRESEARQKLQKELFAFSKCTSHGFPHQPSALAYDPKLKLLALGTKQGDVRVYGRPGVEYSTYHTHPCEVQKVLFLSEQARLVTVCSDNSIHLWEINTKDGVPTLEEIKSLYIEHSKVKNITSVCLSSDGHQLLIGTEAGNVHFVSLPALKLLDLVIYQEDVLQNVPEEARPNAGPVEVIAQSPTKSERVLFGYNKGLVVFYDLKLSTVVHSYNTSQHLESLAWHRDGSQFMSTHVDGSYTVWSESNPTTPKEQATTPYGPFPCKAITKLQWKSAKNDPFIIFSGGMPRASYGDRNTVSVIQGDKQVVFDLTSRIIDFVTMCNAEELEDYDRFDHDDPHSLVILAEEELLVVDLQSDGWPTFRPPYLNSLHASAVTCTTHVANVPEPLWNKITDIGDVQFAQASQRDWPITGGQALPVLCGVRDMLLTGHEDGTVRFWDVCSVSQRLMYMMKTAGVFGEDLPPFDNDGDEQWPPFRKVGTFDPYTDDPRLGIQKIAFCPLSETLVLGGTAGQVIVMQFEREAQTQEIKVTNVNLVTEQDGFVWKGFESLAVKGGDVKMDAGFQPMCVMQLYPPAACTALTVQPSWQVLASGTAHGYVVFDYNQRVEIASKCTLSLSELGGVEEHLSRRKTLKKSLRESFRRLRKGRSGRQRKTGEKTSPRKPEEKSKPGEGIEEKMEEHTAGTKPEGAAAKVPEAAAASVPQATPAHAASELEGATKPVERAVEAKTEKAPDMEAMVRTVYFANTFLLNSQHACPTAWVGTNAGTVYIYQLIIPDSDKRQAEPVKCNLAKEIQLRHHAPVVHLTVLDKTSRPLPAALEVEHERAKAPDMAGGHHVLIVSDEQFKLFSLPNLKATHKFKLTAYEGTKVRRAALIDFRSKSDERYTETDLVVLNNLGEVQVFTLPGLRRQLKAECVPRDNVTGIVSTIFTQTGEGFYLACPSEFQRFSVSARFATKPSCEVLLKDSIRPVLPDENEAKAEPVHVEPTKEEVPAPETVGIVTLPNDSELPEDPNQSTTDVGNDSTLSAGDTSANMTLDSVRVHLSGLQLEESPGTTTVVQGTRQVTAMVHSSSRTTTTVTRTLVSSDGRGDANLTEQTTTTTTVVGCPPSAGPTQSTLAHTEEGTSVITDQASQTVYKTDKPVHVNHKDNPAISEIVSSLPLSSPRIWVETEAEPILLAKEDIIVPVNALLKTGSLVQCPLIEESLADDDAIVGLEEPTSFLPTITEELRSRTPEFDPNQVYGKIEDPIVITNQDAEWQASTAPRIVYTDPMVEKVDIPHTESYHEFLMPHIPSVPSVLNVPQGYKEPSLSRRASMVPPEYNSSSRRASFLSEDSESEFTPTEQELLFDDMCQNFVFRVLTTSTSNEYESPQTRRRHRASIQAELLYNLKRQSYEPEVPATIEDLYIAAETNVRSPRHKASFDFSGVLSDDPNVGVTYTEIDGESESDISMQQPSGTEGTEITA